METKEDKTLVEVIDYRGNVIKEHDVVKVLATNELALVVMGIAYQGNSQLGVENLYIGLNDSLDVYPDRALEIVGNVDYTPEVRNNG